MKNVMLMIYMIMQVMNCKVFEAKYQVRLNVLDKI